MELNLAHTGDREFMVIAKGNCTVTKRRLQPQVNEHPSWIFHATSATTNPVYTRNENPAIAWMDEVDVLCVRECRPHRSKQHIDIQSRYPADASGESFFPASKPLTPEVSLLEIRKRDGVVGRRGLAYRAKWVMALCRLRVSAIIPLNPHCFHLLSPVFGRRCNDALPELPV